MWPDREIAVAGQPGKQAYILLDSGLIERYSRWPHFISTAPKIAYAYVNDYLRLRPDVAIAGPLESIASSRAMPLDGLGEAIAAYNAYVSGEAPDALGRTNDKSPLNGSQWVLLGPVKAYFTTTEGGAAINAAMQVLDDAGQPIEGLYAAGQNGLGGQILWGHGLHIAWAITSGRLAGKAVVQGPRRRP
jgi:fumarate reductase flavoprotein subunit